MRVATLARRLAAAALVALGLGCDGAPTTPDVVLVVIDTLRADHLHHYGYERETAPGLDALRERATLFTEAYATSAWTGPSTASLLTGLFNTRHLLNVHGAALPDEAVTLAERLGGQGYATAAISFNAEVSRGSGFAQGFDHFDDYLGAVRAYPDAGEMQARVARWLDAAPEGPFFLYLQPMNVHGPYRVPEERREELLGRPPSEGFSYYGEPMRGILHGRRLALRERVDDAYLASLVDQYDTAVRYTTDVVGEILGLLDARGRFDDALVIVTSDHGEELFDHGGFSHGFSLHREIVRVPLYVKLPGQREARTSTAPVSLLDVVPSVLEQVRGEHRPPPGGFDGRSLSPELRGDPPSEPRALLQQTSWSNRCVARSVTTDRYRLIQIASNYEGVQGELRLFDRNADPLERNDLARQRPEVARRLLGQLRRSIRTLPAPVAGSAQRNLEPPDRERLEALGYLDEP